VSSSSDKIGNTVRKASTCFLSFNNSSSFSISTCKTSFMNGLQRNLNELSFSVFNQCKKSEWEQQHTKVRPTSFRLHSLVCNFFERALIPATTNARNDKDGPSES
jgi:hypothetical protein